VPKLAALQKRSAMAFGEFGTFWLAKTCSRHSRRMPQSPPPTEEQARYSVALQFDGRRLTT